MAKGQISDIPPSGLNGEDFHRITKKLRFTHKNIDRGEHDEIMTISVGVKFSIKSTGQVSDITFSKNATKSIKDEIGRYLLSSNGLWQPRKLNGVAVDSKPFFVIFAIAFEGIMPKESGWYPDTNYIDAFDFGDDKTAYPFDCLLLPPRLFEPPIR
jgi:hypothetical protein